MRKRKWKKYYAKPKRFDHVFNVLGWVAVLGLVLIVIDTYV